MPAWRSWFSSSLLSELANHALRLLPAMLSKKGSLLLPLLLLPPLLPDELIASCRRFIVL
jgi:hypothetical protein